MDWSGCDVIEQVPGKMGGRPVIRGTRIEPETILLDYQLGSPIEEIHENFPTVPIETIRKILAFARVESPVA